MSFVPAQDCVEAVLRFTLPNLNTAVNVLNFRDMTGTPDENRLEDLSGLLNTWHNAFYDVLQSNTVSLTSKYLRGLTSEFEPVYDQPVTPAQVGVSASPALPANVTLAVSHRTGLAGRSRRGRTYIVGLSEALVSGDFTVAGVTTNANAAFNALRGLTTFVASGWQFVILSKYVGTTPRAAAVITPVTNSFCVDARVDTQRRRLLGTGS